jgi:polysaccharide biosynthesis protein PelD
VVKGLTSVQSEILSRVRSAVPVLPPRFAVVEIFVLLVVPALLEWLWPPFPNLTTFQPHPYWAVILILSLQYGTVSGLLAAAIAIMASVVIGLPEADIGEKHFAYLVRVWTQPVLWIATAFLLGHFRMRQIEQRNELNRRVDELQRRSNTLATHASGLQARCGALERSLATRPRSDAGVLLDTLAMLPTAVPADAEELFQKLIEAGLPGAVGSLYVMGQNAPICVVRTRRDLDTSPKLGPGTPLVAAVLRGEALSVTSGQHDAALAETGVFAVPVYRQPSSSLRRPTGILLIESLPPSQIHRNTVARLIVIAEALSSTQIVSASTSNDRTTNEASALQENNLSLVEGIGESIPEVKSWRQMRWLPTSLRPVERPTADSNASGDERPKVGPAVARR